MTAHTEARRLHALGFKLCKLEPMSKRPVGNGWQLNPVASIEDCASGYGALLAMNNLASIDPDNLEPARVGLARCGFDLEKLMSEGVRTTSSRPGSGGRSTFKAPKGFERVVFSSKTDGTILELRAGQSNLQDCLPGTVYLDKDGNGPYEQHYAGSGTLDEAPDLPIKFLEWWQRLYSDHVFKREQQLLFGGPDAVLSISGKGGKLALASPMRTHYNAAHEVIDILARHAYVSADNERWAPPTASGAPCVRAIPGKDGLWQSDHASDPLNGTFDAWTAHVVLEHGGDVAAAEQAFRPARDAAILSDFDVVGPSTKKPRFRFVKMSEFKLRRPVSWLIRRVFPRAEIGAVFGESGAGKSFFVLDVVLSIARGQDWNGYKVTQGNVAYVVAEGAGSFHLRVDAYGKHRGVDVDELPFFVLDAAPSILDNAAVDDLLAGLAEHADLKVVVLDTLAQVTSGANENSGEDMGRALAAAKRISTGTGAVVLIVAHTGKDASRGIRGWSGIKAALDFEIYIEKAGELRSATITKMKDGDGEGIAFPFTLESVALGVDDEGFSVASCVVNVSGELTKKSAGAKRLTAGRDDVALATVVTLLDLDGAVTLDQWRASAIPQMVVKPGKADNRVRDFSRAVEALTVGGYVSVLANRVQVLRAAP